MFKYNFLKWTRREGLIVYTSQFGHQLAKWVQNCKAVLTLRRESCFLFKAQFLQVKINNITLKCMFIALCCSLNCCMNVFVMTVKPILRTTQRNCVPINVTILSIRMKSMVCLKYLIPPMSCSFRLSQKWCASTCRPNVNHDWFCDVIILLEID